MQCLISNTAIIKFYNCTKCTIHQNTIYYCTYENVLMNRAFGAIISFYICIEYKATYNKYCKQHTTPCGVRWAVSSKRVTQRQEYCDAAHYRTVNATAVYSVQYNSNSTQQYKILYIRNATIEKSVLLYTYAKTYFCLSS